MASPVTVTGRPNPRLFTLRNARRVYALLLLGVGLATLASAYDWWRTDRQNAEITAVAAGQQTTGPTESPHWLLARALALAKSHDLEAASAHFRAASAADTSGVVTQAALYDLGNLYLRTALQDGAENRARVMPLIELAKQNYRKLLALPDLPWHDAYWSKHWPARYNLELALRLAPEVEDEQADNEPPAIHQEQAQTTARPRNLELP